EALLVGAGGGLKNAVLWVPGVPAPKDAPRARARLEQQGCRFEPHVMVAPAGVTLEVVNSDAVLHHPKAMAGEQKVFDFPMPLKGYTVPRRLEKAELVRVTCETHPWMK